jgi:hypothetical protein
MQQTRPKLEEMPQDLSRVIALFRSSLKRQFWTRPAPFIRFYAAGYRSGAERECDRALRRSVWSGRDLLVAAIRPWISSPYFLWVVG